MIKPSIGRVVWVYNRPGFGSTDQPEPALISYIWSDTLINVGGFDHDGQPFSATSLELFQGVAGEGPKDRPYAAWMPYQQAQAQKFPTTGA